MAAFLDFQEIKQKIGIERVLDMLGITLNVANNHQLRGKCPVHGGMDDRGFVVTPGKSLWFCFGGCGGGDIIELVAQVRKVELKQAAQLLAEHFGIGQPVKQQPTGTVPQNESRDPTRPTLKALDYLDADNPAVEAVGFDADIARALGIGWASKGIMKGTVAIPLRTESGELLGYAGIIEARLPDNLRVKPTNIVPLKRGA